LDDIFFTLAPEGVIFLRHSYWEVNAMSTPLMLVKPIELESHFGGKSRKISLEIGRTYTIDPLNPKRLKNRGRIVRILGFNDNFMPDKAIVRYLDTNRRGLVYVGELAHLSNT
jgi:hypothetical protein